MRAPRMYRALLRAYPSRFRREYAEPMAQAFADRVHADGARRAWGVALRDLAISAPNEHWETFMNAKTSSKLTVAAVVTAVAAMFVIAIGGALVGLALLLLLAWELYAIQRARGYSGSTLRGWKFAASGVALFALLFVVFALPWPEDWRSAVDDEIAWFTGMVGFSTAIVLMITGTALGLARWIAQRSSRRAI
ncbi:MAG: hypothetical protein ACHQIG_07945 [Acidimicrobiia bacterium]